MRQRLYKTLFAGLALSLISACNGHGPNVKTCISVPSRAGFLCVDTDDAQTSFFVPYSESFKYVAFPPDDAQKLIDACGVNGHAKLLVERFHERLENKAEEFAQWR